MRGVGRTAGAASSPPTQEENVVKSEIKYKTAGGNTVTWKRDPHLGKDWGSFECGGCGATGDNVVAIADSHAQKCRAL
jgi:hypothetical protein